MTRNHNNYRVVKPLAGPYSPESGSELSDWSWEAKPLVDMGFFYQKSHEIPELMGKWWLNALWVAIFKNKQNYNQLSYWALLDFQWQSPIEYTLTIHQEVATKGKLNYYHKWYLPLLINWYAGSTVSVINPWIFSVDTHLKEAYTR